MISSNGSRTVYSLQPDYTGLAILLSCVFHLCLYLVSYWSNYRVQDQKKTLPAVKISIVHKEVFQPKVATTNKNNSKSSIKTLPPNAEPKHNKAAVPKLQNLSYSDLLQATAELKEQNQKTVSSKRKTYRGNNLGDIKAASSDFAANFDLPLVFRRELKDGRAFATLKLNKEKELEIEYLGGLPEIRAALFETITNKNSISEILQIFAFFRTNYFKIAIEYKTVFGGYSKKSEFETTQEIFDKEVLLIVIRYLETPKYGGNGIPIEDEHSRRAKDRDRDHLARLWQSPAYLSPLMNYKVRL